MDPGSTEIMKNRFSAMVEEAATVAYRTAHTTFVKQTQDFQVALARPVGDFFAFPTMAGATSPVCQSILGFVEPFLNDLQPGDVLVSNDPFRTGGLVTHTMDIHLVRPIFFQDELVCFAWSFFHASDIGGAVPGSISPDNTDIFQEGFIIRPTKLLRAGELNEDVVHFIHDNSRIGPEVWGDLEAMQAAMRLLDQRVTELCAKIGLSSFRSGVESVMDYAEAKARSVISNLRDGTYTFSDYVEAGPRDEAILIHCRLTIEGDEAEVDYSGSDPQVEAALNFPTGNRSHPLLCFALTNYIQTMEPSAPVNGGLMRPIRSYAPPGTIMNAVFPAAMGNRWVAVIRTYDVLVGCLNQAVPGGLTGCGAGQAGIISVAWTQVSDGRRRVSVVEPFSGGSGGRVRGDGVDATDTVVGFLKSTPVEYVEVDTPLLVRRHELVPESFGHGKFRGGASVAIEIECCAPEATMTVRGLDRFRFQPWGVFGGTPGRSGFTVLNTGEGEEAIGRIRVLRLKRGDALRMTSPSGGGFGDPILRDPDRVLRDVLDGMLSCETARDVYGVVIIDGKVDREATRDQRERMGSHARTSAPITHGEARLRFEHAWPVAIRTALARAVLERPRGIRQPLFAAVLDELRASPAPHTVEGLLAVVDQKSRWLQRAD